MCQGLYRPASTWLPKLRKFFFAGLVKLGGLAGLWKSGHWALTWALTASRVSAARARIATFPYGSLLLWRYPERGALEVKQRLLTAHEHPPRRIARRSAPHCSYGSVMRVAPCSDLLGL